MVPRSRSYPRVAVSAISSAAAQLLVGLGSPHTWLGVRSRARSAVRDGLPAWIVSESSGAILFEFRGRTIFEGDEPGRQNLVGWFESDHENYRWLNDLVCIAEGGISATVPNMVIKVYAGIHEM
jgi:hypothetical protein